MNTKKKRFGRCIRAGFTVFMVLFLLTGVPAQDDSSSDVDRTINIEGTEYKFKPDKLTVQTGQTVKIVFKNTGTISHDFFIKELDFKTDPIQPGKTVNYTFTAPDSATKFHFECKVAGHAPAGMKGTIHVKNGNGSSDGGTDESKTSGADGDPDPSNSGSSGTDKGNKTNESNEKNGERSPWETLEHSFDRRMSERRSATVKSGWGVITGTVKLEGEKPAPYTNPGSDTFKQQCGFDGAFEIQYVDVHEKTKGIPDTVVYVEDVEATNKDLLPPKRTKIIQKTCRFHPSIQVVRTGGTLEVLNSDPALHNFRYRATKAFEEGNIVQRKGTDGPTKDEIKVGTTDVYASQCNVHPWMNGMFLAIDHHGYDVTGNRGQFTIQLPAGTYELHVRHYTQKKAKTVKVTVPEGKEKEKDVKLRFE